MLLATLSSNTASNEGDERSNAFPDSIVNIAREPKRKVFAGQIIFRVIGLLLRENRWSTNSGSKFTEGFEGSEQSSMSD